MRRVRTFQYRYSASSVSGPADGHSVCTDPLDVKLDPPNAATPWLGWRCRRPAWLGTSTAGGGVVGSARAGWRSERPGERVRGEALRRLVSAVSPQSTSPHRLNEEPRRLVTQVLSSRRAHRRAARPPLRLRADRLPRDRPLDRARPRPLTRRYWRYRLAAVRKTPRPIVRPCTPGMSARCLP